MDFAAQRVRVAEGPPRRDGQHLPGQLAWLVCERRADGDRTYYLANHPDDTPVETLAGHIKARWVCEQAHQQMKEDLGLDHFEGRSWVGLHHHTVLTMMAPCFLQYLRLEGFRLGKKATTPPAEPATDPLRPGPPPTPSLPAVRRQILKALGTALCPCPNCGHPVRFDHRRLL